MSGARATKPERPTRPEASPAHTVDDTDMRAQIDRLVSAANDLAATIAKTEAITQRRADILTSPRVMKGTGGDGRERRQAIVSLSEAARRTGRHPEVLRRWCTEGRIPAIRVGRTWAIGADTVAELMAHSARSRPRLTGSNSA